MNQPTQGTTDTSGGTLFLVATPIGNLGDISARAREVLDGCTRVYAEDTRCTARLMSALHLDKPLRSLHEHNEAQRVPEILDLLATGENVAVVSDAGTPLISDPGFRLTRAAHLAGIRVSPVPGASAVTAALSVSGLPTDRFLFVGFPPAKARARRKFLQAVADLPWTLVFYESTHRIRESLVDMAHCFGAEREVCLCRELTKRFETVVLTDLTSLNELLAGDADQCRGEFVLVVRGAAGQVTADTRAARRMVELLCSELPRSRAVKLAAKITGVARQALYSRDGDS